MKANKRVRKVQAKRAGFKKPNNYRKFLVEQILEDARVGDNNNSNDSSESLPLDMVIAFDTTGSMSYYLSSVRDHIKDLLDNMFTKSDNDLRVKIVAFGDYCDMESENEFGDSYQEIPLTNNKKELIDFVTNAKRTNGGDSDEFYELVIKKVIEETQWRSGSQRNLFLIGDSNPHQLGYTLSGKVNNSQVSWRHEAQKASTLGVTIDTLQINRSTFWYKELSNITGGVNMEFKNASKISNVIEGLTYVRTNANSFKLNMKEAIKSGDKELINAYRSMTSLLS